MKAFTEALVHLKSSMEHIASFTLCQGMEQPEVGVVGAAWRSQRRRLDSRRAHQRKYISGKVLGFFEGWVAFQKLLHISISHRCISFEKSQKRKRCEALQLASKCTSARTENPYFLQSNGFIINGNDVLLLIIPKSFYLEPLKSDWNISIDHHLQSSQYDTSRVGSHLKRDSFSKLNYQQDSGEKVLEEPSLKISLVREGARYQIEWIFGKVPKGEGGGKSFSIQKFMLQILGTLNRAFWAWYW